MRRLSTILRFAVLGVVLASVFVGSPFRSSTAHARASDTYSALGVVKSFGAERKYVNIAHEKIAGYMEAMTMSFEPRTPDQLAGLDVGDRVSFTFVATEDGRRVLSAIKKEPSTRSRFEGRFGSSTP